MQYINRETFMAEGKVINMGNTAMSVVIRAVWTEGAVICAVRQVIYKESALWKRTLQM